MKRLLLVAPLLMAFLIGCTRGTGTATPTSPPLFGQSSAVPPSPTLPLDEAALPDLMATRTPEAAPVEGQPQPLPTQDTLSGGRFTNLRFASSANGQSQGNFPEGTQEIYAVWDFDGMKAGDTMERVWYLNDQVYVERSEEWDFLKYGFSGTVRDIFLYDRIDGIDPGNWRVELYLNGEKQTEGTFTIGGP